MKDSNTMETVPFDGKTNGEIMLRNNTMMLGYLKNSKATQEAYRNDWYRIRDFGIRHPDRAKDIIVCGGEAISTFKMEPLLLSIFPSTPSASDSSDMQNHNSSTLLTSHIAHVSEVSIHMHNKCQV
ncbi:hypothetical protein FEM48_Zijuj03G0112000 [Ziziphus jujuba var. spinosa]|uniref:AMP-dependent synthetase/ligase domain-containing protein n=1 Tax=Ziziphus jujuba var. spinosa TaxID=714518 RepID=A0A978VPZ3_ZIZJJ|nr:hypothetical protein FEM48_Zijuj03G0112000 [Ziziphus jujuba var. spinosa]